MNFGIVSLEEKNKIKNELQAVENLIDRKLDLAIRYISFEDDFPLEECNIILNCGLKPIITWEFFHSKNHNREFPLDSILEGFFDDYIEEFAKGVNDAKGEILLRVFHEFNFRKHPWSGYQNGGALGGPKRVRDSWLYIVKKFKELDVNNVHWIWCPHEPSDFRDEEPWNSLTNYWPGEDYVDLLGIDGFNFYPENPERDNPSFMDFDNLFSKTYRELEDLSNRDIFIMTGTGEFSYTEPIESKTQWILDMFNLIKSKYKRIKYVGWFHFTFNNKANWRIDSSEESLEAFIKCLS